MSEVRTAQHTPGPWSFTDELEFLSVSNRERSIADVCLSESIEGGDHPANCNCEPCTWSAVIELDRAEQFANARLIAAAPELLAACKRLHAAFIEARNLAIAEPLACTPLVASLQTAGGAQYAAEDAIANAEGGAE